MQTKKEATERGRAVLKRVTGKGWKLRVFENLGWHFTLECGSLSLHQDRGRLGRSITYWCMLSDRLKDAGSGAMVWSHNASHRTPMGAVRAKLRYARSVLKNLEAVVRTVEENIAK